MLPLRFHSLFILGPLLLLMLERLSFFLLHLLTSCSILLFAPVGVVGGVCVCVCVAYISFPRFPSPLITNHLLSVNLIPSHWLSLALFNSQELSAAVSMSVHLPHVLVMLQFLLLPLHLHSLLFAPVGMVGCVCVCVAFISCPWLPSPLVNYHRLSVNLISSHWLSLALFNSQELSLAVGMCVHLPHVLAMLQFLLLPLRIHSLPLLCPILLVILEHLLSCL